MDRSESVTMFNDMCLLAPGTLLDRSIVWTPIDARSAQAQFTHGANQITATLFFDDDGRLTNFMSDDRSRSSPDGRTFTNLRFSRQCATTGRSVRCRLPRTATAAGCWRTASSPMASSTSSTSPTTCSRRPRSTSTGQRTDSRFDLHLHAEFDDAFRRQLEVRASLARHFASSGRTAVPAMSPCRTLP